MVIQGIPRGELEDLVLSEETEVGEIIKRLFNMGYNINSVYYLIRMRYEKYRKISIDEVVKYMPKGKLRLPPEFKEKIYIYWRDMGYPENIQDVLEKLHEEGYIKLEIDDIKRICTQKKKTKPKEKTRGGKDVS
jgi:hypothetical protein